MVATPPPPPIVAHLPTPMPPPGALPRDSIISHFEESARKRRTAIIAIAIAVGVLVAVVLLFVALS